MRQFIRPVWALVPALMMLAACGTDATTTDKTDTATSDTATSDTASDTAGGDTAGVDSVGSDSTAGDATTDADVEDKKYTTCAPLGDCAIAACAATGFAEGCANACLSDANGAALQVAAPLLSCTQKICVPACKDSKEPGCLGGCIFESCTADFLGCITQGVTPAGTDACITIPGCLQGCDLTKASPFTCMTKCIEKTDATGLGLLKAVGECQAKAAKDGKDGDEACGKEQFDCVVSGKSGALKCFEAFGCSETCMTAGGSDEQCMFKCLPTLTKEAQGQFMSMLPCLDDMGAEGCGAKVVACAAPSGTAGCGASVACMIKCSDKDGDPPPSCFFNCIHAAKATSAAATLGVIGACNDGDEPAPTPGDVTPTDAPPTPECIGAMFVCAEPGDTGDNCKVMTACIAKCDGEGGDGFSCALGCAGKGAKAEVKLLSDFMACQMKCEKECDGKEESCEGACVSKDCPVAAAACIPAS